jgi:hypothetical protein
MKWITRGRTHLSAPYSIVSAVRGYEVWYQTKGKYGCLAREIPTLEKAKDFCLVHVAKEKATA